MEASKIGHNVDDDKGLRTRPVVLVVMDGVGVGRSDDFDAVHLANTPNLDMYGVSGRSRTLRAHGSAVGLQSESDMGNSEVGHNILGAGRIFDQGAKRVEKAIASGVIWSTSAWRALVDNCIQRRSTLHLVGLLSDGNVHSSIDHLTALITRSAQDGIGCIRAHVLFDGRDVPDHTAELYLAQLRAAVAAIPGLDFEVASGGGRMVTTMDRYGADWSVVEAGWQAHVLGTAHAVRSAEDGIAWGRGDQRMSDQNLPAFTVVDASGSPIGRIVDGDSVVMFNFRGDRAMEFCQAMEWDAFDHFDRVTVPDVVFAGMALYDGDTAVPRQFLVEPEAVDLTVSEIIAAAGLRQWAAAETQKYGHITYFWNGNRSSKFDDELETYVEIPSDRIPFDQRPWMKSAETADELIEAIRTGRYEFLRVNFAGGDMVGHTASMPATRIAVESVDLAIGRIATELRDCDGILIVTADHGNADDKVERDALGQPTYDPTGLPIGRTAHSLNPVPFIVADLARDLPELRTDLPDAGLANVAATVLQLLGLPVPADYEPSLLVNDAVASPPTTD